jgi:hypothetical protein
VQVAHSYILGKLDEPSETTPVFLKKKKVGGNGGEAKEGDPWLDER